MYCIITTAQLHEKKLALGCKGLMNEFKTNDCVQIDTRSSFKPSVKHCTIFIIWIKFAINCLNLRIPIILYEREGNKTLFLDKVISLKGGSHAQITLFMVNFSVLPVTRSPGAPRWEHSVRPRGQTKEMNNHVIHAISFVCVL